MNWDAIGALAEAVGAIGVIASLLYLASQVRTSNRASNVTAKLESTRMLSDYLNMVVEEPELAALFIKARKSYDELTFEEQRLVTNLHLKAMYYFSAAHYQYVLGSHDEAEWTEPLMMLRFWLRGAGNREWWDTIGRDMVSPRFAAFVDAEIQNLGTGHPIS